MLAENKDIDGRIETTRKGGSQVSTRIFEILGVRRLSGMFRLILLKLQPKYYMDINIRGDEADVS